MNLYFNIAKHKEQRAKKETLHLLRGMSLRMLVDCNISPELLEKGIKAWPWKEISEDVTQPSLTHSAKPKLNCVPTEYERSSHVDYSNAEYELHQKDAA